MPSSQPAPPDIFYGRDELVLTIAQLLVGNEQQRIAILGGGGLGKTSIALHIMHHIYAVQRYSEHRLFIGCDAVTSADTLALRILQIMHAAIPSTGSPVDALHPVLSTAPQTLIVLDNFESIWDVPGDREAIRGLLQTIANVKTTSLIITMRASSPPPGIHWTWRDPISTLLPAPSRQLFLAINPEFCDGSSSNEDILDELLRELDYVPLALHLLAQVSHGLSAAYTLKQWRKRKTQMLTTDRYTVNRLESVEVSISLSITLLDISKHPEAIQLLGMLCLLPDGLFHWQDRLESIEQIFETATADLQLLRHLALVYTSVDRIRVLSPIRHFILHHYPPDKAHTMCICEILWQLVDTYGLISYGAEFQGAVAALSPEIGNISHLIDYAVLRYPSSRILNVGINLTCHFHFTYPSNNILEKVSGLLSDADSAIQARFFEISAKISNSQGKYEQATKDFREAREKYLAVNNSSSVARCSFFLGNKLRMQCRYSEANAMLTEARDGYLTLDDHAGLSRCLNSLGDVLYGQSRYSEAVAMQEDALAESLQAGDRFGAAYCLQSLGLVLRMEGKESEATAKIKEAREEFLEIGYVSGAATCLRMVADLLAREGKLDEAIDMLNQAHAESLKLGNPFNAAACLHNLGDTPRSQGKLEQATTKLEEARIMFLQIGYPVSAAQCLQSLGAVSLDQGRHSDAVSKLTMALEEYTHIEDRNGQGSCLLYLGSALIAQGDRAGGKSSIVRARDIFAEIGAPFNVNLSSEVLEELSRLDDEESDDGESEMARNIESGEETYEAASISASDGAVLA